MVLVSKALGMQYDRDPFVAVYMITYNHVEYISQAIESVIKQVTNFKFKLFIGDDKSTDGTREICISYKEKYPGVIDLQLNENNIGATRNALSVYEKCFLSGARYIAMIEGDDYWLNVNKLQKQVDFLESNSQYSMSFHDIAINKDGLLSPSNNNLNKSVYDLYDYAEDGFIHTSSILFRNYGFENFPRYLQKAYAGDSIIILSIAQQGLVNYIPEVMSVYRLHETGIWSMKDMTFLRRKRLHDIKLILKYGIGNDAKLKKILKSKQYKEYRFLWGSTKEIKYYFKAFSLNPILTLKLSLKKILG